MNVIQCPPSAMDLRVSFSVSTLFNVFEGSLAALACPYRLALAASRRLLQVLLRVAGNATRSFAGADTQGETPDPIPNSEVKSLGPMVVQVGESRLVPVFERPGDRKFTGPRLFLPSDPISETSVRRLEDHSVSRRCASTRIPHCAQRVLAHSLAVHCG